MNISHNDVGDMARHCERREAIQRGVTARSAATGSPRRFAPRDDAGDMRPEACARVAQATQGFAAPAQPAGLMGF